MTVESTAARKPRRSAGTTAAKSGASTTGTKSAASKRTSAAGKKSPGVPGAPGASGPGPELVQLLTPEGERVKDATYDPYVADITPKSCVVCTGTWC